MKKDRILIKKDMIPYRFWIALAAVRFGLEIRYNAEADLFTIGLYDSNKTLLCTEPVIYGAELFRQHYRAGAYPAVRIVPQDENGTNTAVGWDNFGETVFLMIENTGGDADE